MLQSTSAIGLVEPDWQREVAALHYGVSPEKAAQILIEDPLMDSIDEEDQAAFDGLRAIPGFGDVIERVTRDFVADAKVAKTFDLVLKSARLLDRIDEVDEAVRQSWVNLQSACVEGLALTNVRESLPKELAPLLRRLDRPNLLEFTGAFRRFFIEMFEGDEVTGIQMSVLDRAMHDVSKRSAEVGFPVAPFQSNTDPRTFVRHWLVLDHSAQLVRSDLDPDDLQQTLMGFCEDELARYAVPGAIAKLLSADAKVVFGEVEFQWAELVERLERALGPEANADMFDIALRSLVMMTPRVKDAAAALGRLTDGGHIAARLAGFGQAENLEGSALAAAILIWRSVSFGAPSGASWPEYLTANPKFIGLTHQHLQAITDNITIYSLAKCFHAGEEAKKLVESIIAFEIDSGSLGRLNTKVISDNYYYYVRMVPISKYGQFSSLLARHDNFWANLETMPWGNDLVRLARSLLSQRGSVAERAKMILSARVEHASIEDWTASLASRGGPYVVVFELLSKAPELGAQSALREALSGYLTVMLSNTGRQPILSWFKHLALMGVRQRRKLLNELIESIVAQATVERVFDVVKLGGLELTEEMRRSNKPDLVVQKIIITLMKKASGRIWLRDHKAAVKAMVGRANLETRRAISNVLDRLASDRASDRKSFAEVARADWKI